MLRAQNPVLYYLTLIWVIFEIFNFSKGRFKAAKKKVEKQDKGSTILIILYVIVAINLSAFIKTKGWGYINPPWNSIGIVVMILGIILRQWAVFILGQFFSGHLEIKEEHRVIRQGPYRVIRHPSYTGALLTFAGYGLAMSSWISSILLILMFLLIYGYRIKVEEELLKSQLGKDYEEYMQDSWKMIPYIW